MYVAKQCIASGLYHQAQLLRPALTQFNQLVSVITCLLAGPMAVGDVDNPRACISHPKLATHSDPIHHHSNPQDHHRARGFAVGIGRATSGLVNAARLRSGNRSGTLVRTLAYCRLRRAVRRSRRRGTPWCCGAGSTGPGALPRNRMVLLVTWRMQALFNTGFRSTSR